MTSIGSAEQQEIRGNWLVLATLTVTGGIVGTGILIVSPLIVELATEFHTTVAIVGQLVTAGALISGGLGPFYGLLSDRYGRRAMVVLGTLAFGLITILTGWVTDLPTMFGIRMVASIGGSMVAVSLPTIVADYFPPLQRGRALGWLATGLSLASIGGVPVVAFVAEVGTWRWSFRVIGLLLVAFAGVLFRMLPPVLAPGDASGEFGMPIPLLLRSSAVAGLLVANTLERISYGAITTYLAAFLMQSFGLSIGQVAPLIAAVAVGALLGTLLGGRVAGLSNPVTVFILAQGLAVFALFPLAWVHNAVWLSALLAAAYGTANAFSRPGYLWMVMLVGAPVRGAMMGLSYTTNQIGWILGAAVGGLLITIGGYEGLVLGCCAFGLLAIGACRLLVRPEALPQVGLTTAG